MRKSVILLLLFSAFIWACKNPNHKPLEHSDPYGVQKREMERKAAQDWQINKELKKAELEKFLKTADSTKEKEQKTSTNASLSPDNAYQLGYDEGFQQGMYDAEQKFSYGENYDDGNDFYDYYHTKYCEGYEEGYEDGYQNGE